MCIILHYSYDTNAFFTGTNINKVDRICMQSNINDFNISTTLLTHSFIINVDLLMHTSIHLIQSQPLEEERKQVEEMIRSLGIGYGLNFL